MPLNWFWPTLAPKGSFGMSSAGIPCGVGGCGIAELVSWFWKVPGPDSVPPPFVTAGVADAPGPLRLLAEPVPVAPKLLPEPVALHVRPVGSRHSRRPCDEAAPALASRIAVAVT